MQATKERAMLSKKVQVARTEFKLAIEAWTWTGFLLPVPERSSSWLHELRSCKNFVFAHMGLCTHKPVCAHPCPCTNTAPEQGSGCTVCARARRGKRLQSLCKPVVWAKLRLTKLLQPLLSSLRSVASQAHPVQVQGQEKGKGCKVCTSKQTRTTFEQSNLSSS